MTGLTASAVDIHPTHTVEHAMCVQASAVTHASVTAECVYTTILVMSWPCMVAFVVLCDTHQYALLLCTHA